MPYTGVSRLAGQVVQKLVFKKCFVENNHLQMILNRLGKR